MTNQLDFLGQKDNVETKRIIQNSRAFISSTKLYEGQPRSLLRHLAMACPLFILHLEEWMSFFPIIINYLLSNITTNH